MAEKINHRIDEYHTLLACSVLLDALQERTKGDCQVGFIAMALAKRMIDVKALLAFEKVKPNA